jgi:DNA-binding GntR family transcriptional regulator
VAETSRKTRSVPAAQPSRRRAGPAAVIPTGERDIDAGATGRGESIARAYEQLRQMIVRGRLAPGSRVVEAEISERLGVSRTPARSAIHRLQQEGYVTLGERSKERRLIVAPLTQDDARELFEIVGQLEGLAARGAAALDRARRTTVVQQLRRLNSELGTAARQRRPDPIGIFELDTAFHRCYVEAGAGPRLLGLHDATKPQAERYVRIYITSLIDEIATSVEEHNVIVRAIDAGDPPAAQQAVDTNWRNAAQRLSRVIGTLGERGSW